MFLVPEARSAILRTGFVAAVSAACIVGAIRADRRWVRIPLFVVAIPLTLLALIGMFIVSLMLQYGPR
jgi:hypothetical protein